MKYKSGYKHQLVKRHAFSVKWIGDSDGVSPTADSFIRATIEPNATVYIELSPGYAWDGPSGPMPDWKRFMVPSLEHDALYQLIRNGTLPDTDEMRHVADRHFSRGLLKRGWPRWFGWLSYEALTRFGGRHANPENKKKVRVAR